MPTAVPPFRPIQTEFTPGFFPHTNYNGPSGVIDINQQGTLPVGHTLVNTYLLPGPEIARLMAAWNLAHGGYDTLIMPPEAFAHLHANELVLIGSWLEWSFSGEPDWSSTDAPGWSQLVVTFRAEMGSFAPKVVP